MTMRNKIKVIVAALFILTGFLVKGFWEHNYKYEIWIWIQRSSFILLFSGFLLLLYTISDRIWKKIFQINESISLGVKQLIKHLSILVLTIALVYVFFPLGTSINIKLRDYYLKKETTTSTGYMRNTIKYEFKFKSQLFILVDYSVNGEKKRAGLMYELIDHDKIDISEYLIDENIFGTKGPHIVGDSKVKIRHSTKYPSFFTIENE